jgi:protein-disulfide isomerase
MRILLRRWVFVTPLLLAACAITPPQAHNELIDLASDTATGATQQSSASADVATALAPLEAAVLTGTGNERLLQSGVFELGPADAVVTLTVFTESHCVYCNDFVRNMLPWLQSDFPDSLRVRIVPVVLAKYPNSTSAAQALLCAGTTGSGSAMLRTLAERENKHRSSVLEYAEELHIDPASFSVCMDAEITQAMLAVQKQVQQTAGITLVPTFVIENDVRVGLPLYADLRGWIESQL